jgi:hypothetical protein
MNCARSCTSILQKIQQRIDTNNIGCIRKKQFYQFMQIAGSSANKFALAQICGEFTTKHLLHCPLLRMQSERWFGFCPRSIYHATGGFFGVACEHGHIHLNEDDLLFEEETIAGRPDHFLPVITDLRRRSQAIIRYRLNDVLVKLPDQCACGPPLIALQRIEGRCDDVMSFKSVSGDGLIRVMPEALRAVVLDAVRSIGDFWLRKQIKIF